MDLYCIFWYLCNDYNRRVFDVKEVVYSVVLRGLMLMILRPKPEDLNTCPLWQFYRWIENTYRVDVLAEVRGDSEWHLSGKPHNRITVDWSVITQTGSCVQIEWEDDPRTSKILVIWDKPHQRITTMHELGHVLNNREEGETITNEVDAWNWAYKEADKLGLEYNKDFCKNSLMSYVNHYTRSRLLKQRRERQARNVLADVQSKPKRTLKDYVNESMLDSRTFAPELFSIKRPVYF